MTKEEKELLLSDLRTRVPYGVKYASKDCRRPLTLVEVNPTYAMQVEGIVYGSFWESSRLEDVKPYLFPLPSTEGSKGKRYGDYIAEHGFAAFMAHIGDIVWLNCGHFDYNGLIGKGLAIDCTGLGIY